MKSAELLQLYEEQRRYPRIEFSTPVRVSWHKDECIDAMIHDISPEGMQFRMKEEDAVNLIPRSGCIEQARRPRVTLKFSVRANELFTPLEADAEICYALFMGSDLEDCEQEVAFGAEFKKMKKKSKNTLHSFLFK